MREYIVLVAVACGGMGPGGTGGGSAGGSGGSNGNDGGGSGAGGSGALGSDTSMQALSGTRLKVRYIQGEDGSRKFFGFHDTLRNEDCDFGVATDGVQRCLPIASAAYVSGDYFADSNCMQKLAIAIAACAPTQVGYEILSQQCPAQFSMVTLEAISPSIYSGAPGACHAMTASPNQTYYRMTGTIDPGAFAAGTLQTEL